MNTSTDQKSRPGTAINLSHGGGPLPVLGDPGHAAMVAFMEQLPDRVHPPETILDENILVLGSGFSFHNMRRFVWDPPYPDDPDNDAFQDWLVETCAGDLDAATRRDRLVRWEQGPAARPGVFKGSSGKGPVAGRTLLPGR